jgi:hypothetical protein
MRKAIGVNGDKRTVSTQSFSSSLRMQAAGSPVQPVSEAVLELHGHSKTNDEFVRARGVVLDWIGKRSGRPLPPEALRGESFELDEVGSQRTGAVALEAPRYWAARLDDADKEVPQRNWVTEIGIAEAPSKHVVVGTRLLCVTRGVSVPFQPSIQVFVRRIAEKSGDVRVEGRRVDNGAWLVDSEDEVSNLITLLNNKARRLNVVVCSLPEGSENPRECIIDADELHRRTLGAGHVVILTSAASFFLSDQIGKEFSVFRSAVRSYSPAF